MTPSSNIARPNSLYARCSTLCVSDSLYGGPRSLIQVRRLSSFSTSTRLTSTRQRTRNSAYDKFNMSNASTIFDLLGQVDNLNEPVPTLNQRPVAFGLLISFLVSRKRPDQPAGTEPHHHSTGCVIYLRERTVIRPLSSLQVCGLG